MEKVKNSLKVLLTFIFGYLLFSTIVAMVEIVFLFMLSNSAPDVAQIMVRSLKENITEYTITYLGIFVMNIILNYISIKKLNKKLNKTKRKGDNYEK